jgi:hypothetical protein
MKMSPETLDKLEEKLLDELLNSEGAVPAAKLDQIRKILEKNNRLYVRPGVKTPDLLKELDSTDEEANPCVLPFARRS